MLNVPLNLQTPKVLRFINSAENKKIKEYLDFEQIIHLFLNYVPKVLSKLIYEYADHEVFHQYYPFVNFSSEPIVNVNKNFITYPTTFDFTRKENVSFHVPEKGHPFMSRIYKKNPHENVQIKPSNILNFVDKKNLESKISVPKMRCVGYDFEQYIPNTNFYFFIMKHEISYNHVPKANVLCFLDLITHDIYCVTVRFGIVSVKIIEKKQNKNQIQFHVFVKSDRGNLVCIKFFMNERKAILKIVSRMLCHHEIIYSSKDRHLWILDKEIQDKTSNFVPKKNVWVSNEDGKISRTVLKVYDEYGSFVKKIPVQFDEMNSTWSSLICVEHLLVVFTYSPFLPNKFFLNNFFDEKEIFYCWKDSCTLELDSGKIYVHDQNMCDVLIQTSKYNKHLFEFGLFKNEEMTRIENFKGHEFVSTKKSKDCFALVLGDESKLRYDNFEHESMIFVDGICDVQYNEEEFKNRRNYETLDFAIDDPDYKNPQYKEGKEYVIDLKKTNLNKKEEEKCCII